jgi:hypothetical protein
MIFIWQEKNLTEANEYTPFRRASPLIILNYGCLTELDI